MSNLPVFGSPFLNHLSQRIAARRKSLKYHGKLNWETVQPDEFEWLSVDFTPLVGHYCVFQFVEDNRVSVYIESKKRVNRGAILLAIENITIVDNAHDIVDAMETTIVESSRMPSDDSSAVVRAAWGRLEVRVAR